MHYPLHMLTKAHQGEAPLLWITHVPKKKMMAYTIATQQVLL